MARPTKNGLDYFPLDVDIDQDDKVAMIEALYGIEGFGILIKLLMRIYKDGYYYSWDEKEQILFSKRVNVDINRVNDIINACVKWRMFDETIFSKHKILTSKGIQMRFLEVCKRRNTFEMSKELILVPLNLLEKYKNIVIANDNQVNVDNNGVNVNINQESKVKESKVKEIKVKEIKVYNANLMFNSFWDSYPRKESKSKAKEWFEKNKPNQELVDKMLEAIEKFKKTKQWQTKEYIPHPTTWLNQKRWEDEVELGSQTNIIGCKTVKGVPSWYPDYQQQLNSKPQTKEPTHAEKQELEELAKEIFG